MLAKYGLKRLNDKLTRHASNGNSSLLDLILSSDPQSFYGIDNVKTGLSDHDGVICKLRCKDVEIPPQFMVIRNYQKVSAAIIQPEVDNSEDLQSLFTDTDPDMIATKLNNGLNKIAEKIITKKKIQFKKESKSHDDVKMKQAREKIKAQSKVANETRDND